MVGYSYSNEVLMNLFILFENVYHNHDTHPHKFKKAEALKPEDWIKKIKFCGTIPIHTQDPNFLQELISRDKAEFSSKSIFNRKNEHV